MELWLPWDSLRRSPDLGPTEICLSLPPGVGNKGVQCYAWLKYLKNRTSWNWRDGSAVKRKHTDNHNSVSRGSHILFDLPRAPGTRVMRSVCLSTGVINTITETTGGEKGLFDLHIAGHRPQREAKVGT